MAAHRLSPQVWGWCSCTYDESAEGGWRQLSIVLYPSRLLAEKDIILYNEARQPAEAGWANLLHINQLTNIDDRTSGRGEH